MTTTITIMENRHNGSASPFHQMSKRTPTWHLIKSLVVLIVLALAVFSLYWKQQTRTSRSNFLTKASNSSRRSMDYHDSVWSIGTNNKTGTHRQQERLFEASVATTTTTSAEADNGGVEGESDGNNSKICHKVAVYRGSKCKYVRKNCPQPLAGGLINYLHLRYCGFEKVPFFFFACGFFWILLLFYLLSDTAETYFCPSLTEISSYLKLSPNVAGVTFLALGNGAPDIASIVAGVLSGSTGFGVGEPIGAGLFVTTCVMATVTLCSDVKVDGAPFLRDIGTYLLSVVFVLSVCVRQGEIRLWNALTCLSIYIVYVSVVVVGRAIHVGIKSRKLAKEKKLIELQKKGSFSSPPKAGTTSAYDRADSKTSLLDNIELSGDKESSIYYVSVSEEYDAEIEAKWTKEPVLIHYVEQTVRAQDEHVNHSNTSMNNSKKNENSSYESEKFVEEVTIIDTSSDDSDSEEDETSPTQIASMHQNDQFHKWGNLKVQNIHNRQQFARSLKRRHGSGFFFPKVLLESNHLDSPNISLEDELVRTNAFIFEDHFDMSNSTIEEDEGSNCIETEDSYIQQFSHWIEWDEKSWFDRLFYILVSPTILARNLTIPQADPVCWSKVFAVLCPLFMGPFILFATGGLNVKLGHARVFPLWALILIITVFISIFILLTTSRSKPPLYHFIFVFAAFASSVIWIYLVANELVAILQSCGIMWRISDGILAITVLAWGNSLGDMVANVVVARQGYPEMAIGACYGGPCLNLLIGLGLSMTAHCIKFGSFPVVLESNVLMSFIFLLASILAALLVVPVNGFRVPKAFGVFLLGIYGIFMVMSIMIESGLIFRQV